jgi:predicted nucleic acid-binding protein
VLILDANILIRAVLGKRVRAAIETYGDSVSFFVPEPVCAEAEEHLAALMARRGGDLQKALAIFRSMLRLMEVIGAEVYGASEAEARARLGTRDPEDWPVLAAALTVGCPIRTEDIDLFGCGVGTWSSSRVEMSLSR